MEKKGRRPEMWAKFLSVVKSPCPPKGLHFLFPLSQKCHLGLGFVKRNIHCSSPGSRSLVCASCWHCRDYKSHESWVWLWGFTSAIAEQIKWQHVKWVGRLLLTNKSLSSHTKLCCTSNETDHCFSFHVSTILPPGLREIQTWLRFN